MKKSAASMQAWIGSALDGVALADLQLDSRKVCANDVFFALSGDACY
jgi:UDP-N-acetylmuramyl pentapeptide synthase